MEKAGSEDNGRALHSTRSGVERELTLAGRRFFIVVLLSADPANDGRRPPKAPRTSISAAGYAPPARERASNSARPANPPQGALAGRDHGRRQTKRRTALNSRVRPSTSADSAQRPPQTERANFAGRTRRARSWNATRRASSPEPSGDAAAARRPKITAAVPAPAHAARPPGARTVARAPATGQVAPATVRQISSRPMATTPVHELSSTQVPPVKTKEALLWQETPVQGLDQWCAA
jgi:hypothetical protein